MPLSDHATDPKRTGKPCSVGYALSQLDGDDLATLRDWLGTAERRGKSAAVIFEDFNRYADSKNLGFKLAFQSINRHRGEMCGCYK